MLKTINVYVPFHNLQAKKFRVHTHNHIIDESLTEMRLS